MHENIVLNMNKTKLTLSHNILICFLHYGISIHDKKTSFLLHVVRANSLSILCCKIAILVGDSKSRDALPHIPKTCDTFVIIPLFLKMTQLIVT